MRDGEHALSETEVRLLTWLARHPGRPVSRDKLQVEVWGYAEGVVSRAVDSLVKRLRKKIELDPGQPVLLATIPGEGYAWNGPVLSGRPEGARLPRYPDVWVGREAELARAQELVSKGARLVSVVGPAGAGKTRLVATLAAAEDLAGRPAWFAELADAENRGDLVEAVLAALGTRVEAKNRESQLEAALRGREGVLVLDNLEQVADLAADMVALWLTAAPQICFVCTSRVQLEIRGERVLRLGPLDQNAAVALYLERARASWSELDVGADDRAVAELVDRLDRLPLAIELAASRAGVLGPRDLLARLEKGLGVLEGKVSLSGALAASWTLLEGEDRTAVRELCVFRGGFSLEGAEAVLTDGPGAADRVQSLARQSLIRVRTTPDGRRFQLYQAIRAFVREREGDDASAMSRHAAWTANEGQRAAMDWLHTGNASALRWIRSERLNLAAAWERNRQTDPDTAARALLADEMGRAVVGPEDRARAARLREISDAVSDPSLHARAEILLAARERNLGDIEASLARLETLGSLDEPLLESERLANIALAYGHRGRPDEAEQAWHASLALVEQPRVHRHSQALLHLGSICRGRGDYAGARAYRMRAISLSRSMGDPSGLVWALSGLAGIEASLGHIGEARKHLPEALIACEDPECTVSRSVPWEVMGLVALESGDLDDARQWCIKALDEAKSDGMVQALNVSGLLGAVLVEAGEVDAGMAALRVAISEYAGMGWRIYEGIHTGGLGMAALLVGRPEQAIVALERAVLLLAGDTAEWSMRLMLAAACTRTGDAERGARELAAVDRDALGESPPILWDLCAAAVDIDRDAAAVLKCARDPELGPESGRSWVDSLAYVRWAALILEAAVSAREPG